MQASDNPGHAVIRVLIADDEWNYASAIARRLDAFSDIEVVYDKPIRTGEEAVQLSRELRADAVVLDLALGGIGSRNACIQIIRNDPNTVVIVLTSDRTQQSVDRYTGAGGAGAMAYLVKTNENDGQRVVEAIRRARQGVRSSYGKLIQRANLTTRQLDVLPLLLDGYSKPEMADQLDVTVKTIEKHVAGIYRALGVHSRAEAVEEARRQRLHRGIDP